MRSSWWKIIFTALLLCIVTLLSTFIVRQQKIKQGAFQRVEQSRRTMKGYRPGMEYRFKKDLNFSDEQIDQLEKHRTNFHTNMQISTNKRRQLENKLYENHNLSDEELAYMMDSLGELFAAQQRLKYEYVQTLRKICTEEQRQKIDSLTNLSMHRNIKNDGMNMRKRHGIIKESNKQLNNEKDEKH